MAVDMTLAKHNENLAARAVIVEALDARLALIDPAQNVDKYYVLQGLEDPDLDGPKRFYTYQHWGRTGTAGDGKLEGPSELLEVKARLGKVFKEKTGAEWGSIMPGSEALEGKYWLQQQATPDLKASWEYYINDGVDGKKDGWYPYEPSASDDVEVLHAQHVANAQESRTATRVVASGYFSYRVDLKNLTQQNTRTGKVREIRRVLGSGSGLQEPARKATKKLVAPKAPARRSAAGSIKASPRKVVKAVMKVKPRKVMKEKNQKKAAKKLSTIAKGKRARSLVWRGKKERTSTGLRKADLKKNADGKLVTKRASDMGKKHFVNIARWVGACKRARQELGLKGFVAVKKGLPLYEKAHELYRKEGAEAHVLRVVSSEALAGA